MTATAMRPRILVIDDNEVLGRSFARMLRSYDTSVECDPRRGLARILAGEAFAIVMCDLHMPALTGHEVLAAIRAFFAERAGMPQIVMMSAGEELTGELGTELLVKPCSAADVRGMVDRLLETPAT